MREAELTGALRATLAAHRLEALPASELALLRFDKGALLCRAELPLTHLLLVVSGRAKISAIAESGRTFLFGFSGPGDVLGDVELLTGDARASTTVQAITPMACLGIGLSRAQAVLQTDAAFSNHIGAQLAQKLRRNTLMNAEIILQPLEARLRRYLAMTAQDGYFSENLTVLAELLGVSYRHLLRTFDALCDAGALRREGRGFLLLFHEGRT